MVWIGNGSMLVLAIVVVCVCDHHGWDAIWIGNKIEIGRVIVVLMVIICVSVVVMLSCIRV